jgi:cephalosporin-C deacetylase-like acetyl esterase/PKD repeat protein
MSSRFSFIILLLCSSGAEATEASPQEVADFWGTVFGSVPPLNASRSNERVIGNVRVWDVAFDSYRDPSTSLPVRLGGYFAVPTNRTPPGPGGTFPGLVNTHSTGGCATCGGPREGLETALYYAEKGYASLAFYVRGYPPSSMSNPADNSPSGTFYCRYLPDDTQQPFDVSWTGYAVDVYQAGELMAAQPEVWTGYGLTMFGHSLGGYVAAIAGIFSERFRFIAASAPPTTGADVAAWMAVPGNPLRSCVLNLPGTQSTNLERAIRAVSFIGVYQAINSALLVAEEPAWRLDDTTTFYYGGDVDTAVPAGFVEDAYLRADASNNFAFHWSPTGGHGGPESFYRSEAWFANHYPGVTPEAPVADLEVTAESGLTVTFSARASVANDEVTMRTTPTGDGALMAYLYDFGDGARRSWGDVVTHSYAGAGTYTAQVTVTDAEGLRDTAQVSVTVGGVAQIGIVVDAPSPLIVDEGGSVVVYVNLSRAPGTTVNVDVARASGDVDLVASPVSLGFSDANWNVRHAVTLTAAEDADTLSSAAQFTFSGSGLAAASLDASENDDDAPYELIVGNATGAPGDTVAIDIALSNPDGARLRSLSVTLGWDAAALGEATMERGDAVPGPAWWSFGASSPSPGVQTIGGSQIAQPEGAIIDGVIAVDAFVIPIGTSPGTYDVIATVSDFGGRPADRIRGGTVTVSSSAAPDGGPADDGAPLGDSDDGDTGSDSDSDSDSDSGESDNDRSADPTPPAVPGAAPESGCRCDATGLGWGCVALVLAALRRRREARR